jgi:superfamily II DNA/RNA helicase
MSERFDRKRDEKYERKRYSSSSSRGREESKREPLPREIITELAKHPLIPAETVVCLNKMKVEKLFPIQAHSFGPIYDGSDVLARDLTGSGKTLAFSLPLIERFRKEGLFEVRQKKVLFVCLTPTRELAI